MKIKLEFDSIRELYEFFQRTAIEEADLGLDPMSGLAPMKEKPSPAPEPGEEAPTPEPVTEEAPAPVAPAPKYTMDVLAGAMAALIDEDDSKMGLLSEAIKKYGVPAINALGMEHYDSFAEDLKALGAKL